MAGFTGIEQDIAAFSGKLWYSRKQWRALRDKGALRTFARLVDGTIVEYTEMHTFPDLIENPNIIPIYDDAESRGLGTFHHHEDIAGRIVFLK